MPGCPCSLLYVSVSMTSSICRRRHVGACLLLLLLTSALSATSPALAAVETVEAETLSFPATAGQTYAAGGGGRALLLWSNATASGSVTTSGAGRLSVWARGDKCGGAPRMTVRVDGGQVLSTSVSSSTFAVYGSTVDIPSGAHDVAVSYTNDYRSATCDRNLRVDAITFTSDPVVSVTNPLAGVKLYVDPLSSARQQADAWRSTRPADAAQMDKIAVQPQADWFGAWSGDIETAVRTRVQTAAADGAAPVLVAYNVPQRDCGGYSAGGLGSADAYRTWIRAFAAGIGTRVAAVILEPDALAMLSCLSAAEQATRLSLLKDAVGVLEAQAGVSVYLDAGHSAWIGAADMAGRLTSAGIAQAQGFALNVSNYRPVAELVSFGKDLSTRVGGKHFVLDTSRNGLGPAPDDQWCNPPGRALGATPRTSLTADPSVDAYLWIKRPGESDGTCNGGPSAGTFWADYALGRAQRAP